MNKYGLTSAEIKKYSNKKLVKHIYEQLKNNDYISYATWHEIAKRKIEKHLIDYLKTKVKTKEYLK